MIILEQKPFEEILDSLKGKEKIFLVGCTLCATTCGVGGEKEVKEMAARLKGEKKMVTGWAVLDPACHLLESKKAFHKHKEELAESDAILVLSCGSGVQTVREGMKGLVRPGCNTLFLGEIARLGEKVKHFEERCSLCGDCLLDLTGGYCPVTLCSKGLLNGPCGGSQDGKCEVDPERDCGWVLIYEELKKRGELDKMKQFQPPRDYGERAKPQKLFIEK